MDQWAAIFDLDYFLHEIDFYTAEDEIEHTYTYVFKLLIHLLPQLACNFVMVFDRLNFFKAIDDGVRDDVVDVYECFERGTMKRQRLRVMVESP
jgi:hypothetical protein